MARLTYSAFVRGLTVVLPLVALALLSTIFLVARTAPDDNSLPYLEDLQTREGGAVDGMQAPFYSGMTEDGDAVTVRADLVTGSPMDPDTGKAQRLQADIRFDDGSDLTIEAETGTFVGEEDALHLEGNVTMRTSTGYNLYTESLVAELSSGKAHSDVAVQADGPPGTIEAGGMEVRRENEDQVQLVFTNRVKLIYQPPTRSE